MPSDNRDTRGQHLPIVPWPYRRLAVGSGIDQPRPGRPRLPPFFAPIARAPCQSAREALDRPARVEMRADTVPGLLPIGLRRSKLAPDLSVRLHRLGTHPMRAGRLQPLDPNHCPRRRWLRCALPRRRPCGSSPQSYPSDIATPSIPPERLSVRASGSRPDPTAPSADRHRFRP